MFRRLVIIALLLGGCTSSGCSRQRLTEPRLERTHPLVALALHEDSARVMFDRRGRILALHLSGLRVRDEHLHDVGRLRFLRTLELTGTGVTDEAGASLAEAGSLVTLKLSQTAVTDAIVPSLLRLKALQDLGLAHNPKTHDGVQRLRAGLPRACVYW